MIEDFIGGLRCVVCASPLHLRARLPRRPDCVGEFGTIECTGCHALFPLVADVAILRLPDERLDVYDETTARTRAPGPRVGDILAHLDRNDPLQALALLIPVGPGTVIVPDAWFPAAHRSTVAGDSTPVRAGASAGSIRELGRLLNRVLCRAGIVRNWTRKRLARFLVEHARQLSALDLIDLFYRRIWDDELSSYFGYRFGQPRHLAALSVAREIVTGDGPILDLACGAGHLTHYFSWHHPNRLVIGMDRDFFRLYLARHYVAPGAYFVCLPAEGRWPFADHFFSTVFCSDAFHYFPNASGVVAQIGRTLARDGNVAITRFGNAMVSPNEGYELTLGDYRKLLQPLGVRFFGENSLVQCYLRRGTLADADPDVDAVIEKEKWFSAVGVRTNGARGAGDEVWPHASGVLSLNPIYAVVKGDGNGLQLELRFPSPWYEFENAKCLEYLPRQCRLPRDILNKVVSGKRDETMEPYIRQFVLVGLPEAYSQSDALNIDRSAGR